MNLLQQFEADQQARGSRRSRKNEQAVYARCCGPLRPRRASLNQEMVTGVHQLLLVRREV